jgi:hypothetical protein
MDKKTCIYCKKIFSNRWQQKYCSNNCQFELQYENYITKWKSGEKSGNIGINTRNISRHLKRYLLEKYNYKCSKCGWNKKHPTSGVPPLEIDHIDGNSENNTEYNLRVLCPNCHALTSNFKKYNNGKGRKWRINKYIKNSN